MNSNKLLNLLELVAIILVLSHKILLNIKEHHKIRET
jgi:hypothetical protein